MKFNNNEEAVSPVIGVILMVAITVILAAVIAVFVFGMTDDVQSTHVVSITSKVVNTKEVVLTFQGGASAGQLEKLNVTVFVGTTKTYQDWTPGFIGNTTTVTATAKPSRLLIVGKFSDGAEQIVLDKGL